MSHNEHLSPDKLADLWMNQSALSWSRIKAAFGFQAAIIAGWYYSMTDDLPEVALPLAGLGLALAVTFTLLARADLRARNDIRDGLLARNMPLPIRSRGRGARFGLALIFVVLLACNGAMAWTSWKHPDCMAAPADDDSQSVSRVTAAPSASFTAELA